MFVRTTTNNVNIHCLQLFKIKEKVQKLQQDGDTELNPDCMLYVCNKWDNVDEKEEKKVFEEIHSRLRRNGIEVKEGQLLKLSIKKVEIKISIVETTIYFPLIL